MVDFNQTPASGTVPTRYVRGPVPQDAQSFILFLAAELKKIERSIDTLLTLTPQAATKAPERPVENMIRYAKAPWRPVTGQSDDKWVTFVGGSWVYLPNA